MALNKIQHRTVTFDIITRASEPLVLDDHMLEQLRLAFQRAVESTIDLRYYPESRHVEERHEYLGVDLPTEGH